MTVRFPVRRSCSISPTITANGVISIRSRLTRFCLCVLLLTQFSDDWHETGCKKQRHMCAMPSRRQVFRFPSDTMQAMRKFLLLASVVLIFCSTAAAQEATSDDHYDFILAKLAAQDGRYDEAVARIDKVAARNPKNPVL